MRVAKDSPGRRCAQTLQRIRRVKPARPWLCNTRVNALRNIPIG
jgi:hypothetical protein